MKSGAIMIRPDAGMADGEEIDWETALLLVPAKTKVAQNNLSRECMNVCPLL
jgi:hypothetical protein